MIPDFQITPLGIRSTITPTARLESTRIATHESIVMPRNVNPDACMDPVLGEGIAARAPETIMEVRP